VKRSLQSIRRRLPLARVGVGTSLAALAALLLIATPPLQAAAATCATDGNHWYAQARSGCCDTGTLQVTFLPEHWSVYHPADSTTDEGTWILDNNNENIAIESGYYSGYFPYDRSWTNGLLPYYTLNNGASGHRCSTCYLSAGEGIDIDAVTGGRADIGSTTFNFSYSVPNAFNFGMGEVVSSTATWMGGGSGETFDAYWSPNYGANWYLWGYNNDCNNSPYWISQSSGHEWSNGGY
jgi:hypothetical protein